MSLIRGMKHELQDKGYIYSRGASVLYLHVAKKGQTLQPRIFLTPHSYSTGIQDQEKWLLKSDCKWYTNIMLSYVVLEIAFVTIK